MKSGVISAFILLAVTCIPLQADDQRSPNEVFRSAQKIVTTDGIQEQKLVKIGGIDQWISIRGKHRDNPIMLVLHGGPGFTLSPSSYYFMKGWDEYFTVVQWDQRGAGKTYLANDPAKVRPTLTLDRMVDDAAELVQHLRQTYGKKRIVLFAHSFGTVLGTKLAQRHPDWFYAYVATGQVVEFHDNERMGYEATLAAARADHNDKAIKELEAIAPFPDPTHAERNLQNLGPERRWLAHYGGYYWRDNTGHEDDINRFSPDYTADELKARDVAQGFSDEILWGSLASIDFRRNTHFGCPVVFLQGSHDLGTNATLLGRWYETLSAPKKKLVWFNDSAHMVFEEEPGKFLVTLVNEVVPLTRKP